MILRPLAKLRCIGKLLKINGKEISLETRLEYVKEDDEQPDRQRCFGPDGLETDSELKMLELLGVRNPYVTEHRRTDDEKNGEWYFPAGPADASLTHTYEYTLRGCNYYFRDH